MAALLIIAHAPLASALKAVAAHVYPDCAQPVQALDVQPGDSLDDVEHRARQLLASDPDVDRLVLTDVFGATPCNAALRLADDEHVRVVTGVNVPMLWRSVCYAGEPLDALVGRALTGASQGVMQVAPTRPQNQNNKMSLHDEVEGHHQQ